MNILKLSDSTNKILNSKDFVYPDDFIIKVNKVTGVHKSCIKSVCESLHISNDTEIINDIARLIIICTLINSDNGNKNFLKSLIADKIDEALKKIFRDMNKLMMTLDCGKKSYCDYSYEWRKRLKKVVLFAIGYYIKKNILK
ncbi:MAG TPA: hypothetical protein PLH43_12105 [Acetivibrio sp.]|mgnify:FL=1|uniref:hypothetical protein n=1 Tax=Acetivibrio sp. TaxID=1872092 RepID=UPI002C260FD3|nr:hypothetical protein [Acetivibrio sp.]HOM03549.1 hypothetical protein [Acetivibrio sp.]HQH43818.1 hypothetical protein [Syntrophorhabdaceae bacterium]